MVRTFDKIGLSRELLRHNVRREAFLIPLVSNLQDYMEGLDSIPDYIDVSFEELAAYWRDRWLLPRSERVDGWHAWMKDEIATLLTMK